MFQSACAPTTYRRSLLRFVRSTGPRIVIHDVLMFVLAASFCELTARTLDKSKILIPANAPSGAGVE